VKLPLKRRYKSTSIAGKSDKKTTLIVGLSVFFLTIKMVLPKIVNPIIAKAGISMEASASSLVAKTKASSVTTITAIRVTIVEMLNILG
jgi:hypothetical protein